MNSHQSPHPATAARPAPGSTRAVRLREEDDYWDYREECSHEGREPEYKEFWQWQEAI